jgi:molybdopterin-guanine dinucleotide biosynthesis protein A
MAEVDAINRGAIILCGGKSARMGHDKAWLPFGPNEVMLQRVVRLLGEAITFERIVCVASADQVLPRLPERVSVACDRDPDCGPLAGLATGVAAIAGRADAVFVTGCDVPLLVPALVSRMFECLGEHELAVPDDGHYVHPLAAVYRTRVLPIVESLLASGERSLMSVIERCHTARVDSESLRGIDPELSSLANCNTPEDYRRALAAAGFPA